MKRGRGGEIVKEEEERRKDGRGIGEKRNRGRGEDWKGKEWKGKKIDGRGIEGRV